MALVIHKIRKNHNERQGENFEVLRDAHRVQFEREIIKKNKSTERKSHRNHFKNRHFFNFKYSEFGQNHTSDPSEQKVNASEQHVRKVIFDINELVQRNYHQRSDNFE
jgi:hypothetical protein